MPDRPDRDEKRAPDEAPGLVNPVDGLAAGPPVIEAPPVKPDAARDAGAGSAKDLRRGAAERDIPRDEDADLGEK
jgi:hypothetical protein